jgi:hypothetical protein
MVAAVGDNPAMFQPVKGWYGLRSAIDHRVRQLY